MSDELEPALEEAEWATLGPEGRGHPITPSCIADLEYLPARDAAKAMAVANWRAADAYKITRADVQMLRDEASFAVFPERPRHMRALAAKLESLLPPETP